MKKSIVRNYLFLSIGFGVIMGVIFPFFSEIFNHYKQESYRIYFILACIFAGIAVGGFSFVIGKLTVLKALKKLSPQMEKVSLGNLHSFIALKSDDEIGKISESLNHCIQDLGARIIGLKERIERLSKDAYDLNSQAEASSTLMEEMKEDG